MSAAVPTGASKIPRLSSGGQASSPARSPTKSLKTSTTPSKTTPLVQQLRDDIAQLKRKLDEEASQTRRLKREKVRYVQRARSEERQRCKDSLADQKYRLQQEKDREIETLRAQWTKNHTLEINKILREREEFSKAGKDADRERAAYTQRLREQILAEAGEEAKRSFAADRKRFTQEIEELRSTQKKLERELSESKSAIRHSSEDLRRLTESHRKDLESLKKAARKDIIILIDELKAKDRVIIDLEKELGHQAGYAQRLAAERDSTREELNLAKLRDIWEKTDISQRSREGSFINSSSLDLRKSPKLASSSDEPSSDKTENNSTTSQSLPKKEHFRSQNKRLPRETLASRGSPIHSWGSPLPSTGIPTPKTHARRTLPTVGHVRGKTVPLATPTQKELQKSEEARQKLDRKCRLLEDELRKLRREAAKTNRRSQTPWTTERMDQIGRAKGPSRSSRVRESRSPGVEGGVEPHSDEGDEGEMKEEIGRLRRQLDEHFEEIVELKESARADKKHQIFSRRRYSIPSETQSECNMSLNSSLAFSVDMDDSETFRMSLSQADVESRGSLSRPTPSSVFMGDHGDEIRDLQTHIQEMESSQEKLLVELHDSREQKELLEFQLLEVSETDDSHPAEPMYLITELLREVHRYVQDHGEEDLDLSEIKQQVDRLTNEKGGLLTDVDKETVGNLRAFLDVVELELLRMHQDNFDLQQQVDEGTEELHILRDEMNQLLRKLTDKEETILSTNKQLDELLENEFGLVEKLKQFENEIAVLEEELLELREANPARESSQDPSRNGASVSLGRDAAPEETVQQEFVDPEQAGVQLATLGSIGRGNMSGEESFGASGTDDEEVVFSDDDSLGDLLPVAESTHISSREGLGNDSDRSQGIASFITGTDDRSEALYLELEEDPSQAGFVVSELPEEDTDGLSGDSHSKRHGGRPRSGSFFLANVEGSGDQEISLESEVEESKKVNSLLEGEVSQLEQNERKMSQVISDQMIEIRNLKKDAEKLISQDSYNAREEELRAKIKQLESTRVMHNSGVQQDVVEKMAVLESETSFMEQSLKASEAEKKSLYAALEREKLSRMDDEGVQLKMAQIEECESVLRDLGEKQDEMRCLVEGLEEKERDTMEDLERSREERNDIQGEITDLHQHKEEVENHLLVRKTELEELGQEHDSLRKQLNDLERKLESAVKTKEGQSQTEDDDQSEENLLLREKVGNLVGENLSLSGQCSANKELLEEMEVEKVNLEERLGLVESSKNGVENELGKEREANFTLTKEAEANNQRIAEVQETCHGLQRTITEKENIIAVLKKNGKLELMSLQKQLEQLQNDKRTMEGVHETEKCELQERLSEVESAMKTMERDFMKKEEEIGQLNKELGANAIQVAEMEASIAELMEKAAEKEDVIVELRNSQILQMSNLGETMEELQHSREVVERLGSEKCDLQEHLDRVESKKIATGSDLQKEKEEHKRLAEEMENNVRQITGMESTIAVLQKDLTAKETAIDELQKKRESEMTNLEEALEELKVAVDVLEKEKGDLQVQLEKAEENGKLTEDREVNVKLVAEMEGTIVVAEKENDIAGLENDEASKMLYLNESLEELHKSTKTVEELEEEKCDLLERLNKAESAVDAMGCDLNSEKMENVKLAEEIANHVKQVREMESTIAKLQKEVSTKENIITELHSSGQLEMASLEETIEELKNNRKTVDELVKENAELQRKLKKVEMTMNTMGCDLGTKKEGDCRLAEDMETCANRMTEMEDTIAKLRKTVTEKEEAVSDVENNVKLEMSGLEDQLEQLQISKKMLEEENVTLAAELQEERGVKEDTNKMLAEKCTLEKNLEELMSHNEMLQEELRNKDEDPEEMQTVIKDHEVTIKEYSLEVANLKGELEKLEREFKLQQSKFQDQVAEMEKLLVEIENRQMKEAELRQEVESRESAVHALKREVEQRDGAIVRSEESESKLMRDLMEKDTQLQALRSKELELQEEIRTLLSDKVGGHDQEVQGGSVQELEERKVRIGALEDELKQLQFGGSDMFASDDDSREEEDLAECGAGERTPNNDERMLTGGNTEIDDNIYTVVEHEVWEEVEVSQTLQTFTMPPITPDNDREEQYQLLIRQIRMQEAELKTQRKFVKEEMSAKEALEEDLMRMLQSEADLKEQLSTLLEQNSDLQERVKYLTELESEIESLRSLVEKLTVEKQGLELRLEDAEMFQEGNNEKLQERGQELERMKGEVDKMEDDRRKLIDKVLEMENNMKAVVKEMEMGSSLDMSSSGHQMVELGKLNGSSKAGDDMGDETGGVPEEHVGDRTRISLDTSELDSLLFSSDDESEQEEPVDETVDDKVQRLEKLNRSLKTQVKHLLTFQGLAAPAPGDQKANAEEHDEVNNNEGSTHDEEHPSDAADHADDPTSIEDLRKQLAISEENNSYLNQQLEDLKQLMQDGGFENQELLIEKVDVMEKSQRKLCEEIDLLKRELTEKEEELKCTKTDLLNTEDKFSLRVGELEESEQRLLENLEANNKKWRSEADCSQKQIAELEGTKNDLRKQLSLAEEQVEEMMASQSLGNLNSTRQSGMSLLDEGLGALDIGRTSFDDFEDDFIEDNGGIHREMEEALRSMDNAEEESADQSVVNDHLSRRVDELEKSEVELMEKVAVLEEKEKVMTDLCGELERNLEEKIAEINDLREALKPLEQQSEESSNDNENVDQEALLAEISHLQEQVMFMEEEREELLTKIRDFSPRERESPEHEVFHSAVEQRPLQYKNQVEIDITQWRTKSVRQLTDIENPIRVCSILKIPFWGMGASGECRSAKAGINFVESEDLQLEVDVVPDMEFKSNEEFLQKIRTSVEERRPRISEVNFEEMVLVPTDNIAVEVPPVIIEPTTECSGRPPDEDALDVASFHLLVNPEVVRQDFDEVVLQPSHSTFSGEEDKPFVDFEEDGASHSIEPVLVQEENIPVEMSQDLFAKLSDSGNLNEESGSLVLSDEFSSSPNDSATRGNIQGSKQGELKLEDHFQEPDKSTKALEESSDNDAFIRRIKELERTELVLRGEIRELEKGLGELQTDDSLSSVLQSLQAQCSGVVQRDFEELILPQDMVVDDESVKSNAQSGSRSATPIEPMLSQEKVKLIEVCPDLLSCLDDSHNELGVLTCTDDTLPVDVQSNNLLRERICELEETESSLNDRIAELETVQGAFEETLGQADAIMKEREAEYIGRIQELETLQQLQRSDQEGSQLGDHIEKGHERDIQELRDRILELEDSEMNLNNDLEESRDNEARLEQEVLKLREGEGDETYQEKELVLMRGHEIKIQELKDRIQELENSEIKLSDDLKESRDNEEKLEAEILRVDDGKRQENHSIELLEDDHGNFVAQEGNTNELQEMRDRLEQLEKSESKLIDDLEKSLENETRLKQELLILGDGKQEGTCLEDQLEDDEGREIKIRELKDRIQELEDSEMKLINELQESMENEEKLREEIADVGVSLGPGSGTTDGCSNMTLGVDSQSLGSRAKLLRNENKSQAGELAGKVRELLELEEKADQLEEMNHELEGNVESIHQELDKKDKELLFMKEELSAKSIFEEEMKKNMSSLEDSVESLRSNLADKTQHLEQTTRDLKMMRDDKDKREKNVKDLKMQLESLDHLDSTGKNTDDQENLGRIGNKAPMNKDNNSLSSDQSVRKLQEDLHLANIQIEDLKRAKIALEEQLKKLRQNMVSNNMVTISEEEYHQLKSTALPSEESPSAEELDSIDDKEEFENAGKLWVTLDQTTKELRKYQELYNTTIKEVGHLKQALKDATDKHEAYMAGMKKSRFNDSVHVSILANVEHKEVQTEPLRRITADTLQLQLNKGGQSITLQELLNNLPAPSQLNTGSSLLFSMNRQPLVTTGDDIFCLESIPPHLDDSTSFPFEDLPAPQIDERDIQFGSQEGDILLGHESVLGTPPPLPTLFPAGGSVTSSDQSPELPPLPAKPPPMELSFVTEQDGLLGSDMGDGAGGPPDGTRTDLAGSGVLKDLKMDEWRKIMEEADELMEKVRQLEETVKEKDSLLRDLQLERGDLLRRAEVSHYDRHFREKLTETEAELAEKVKEITRLKGDLKRKEAEMMPVKIQFERLQDQYKDKEHAMRLMEAEQIRLKEKLAEKERALFTKEREVEDLRVKQTPSRDSDSHNEVVKPTDENQKTHDEYLREQNERLRRQVDQLEPLKERMANLEAQLERGLGAGDGGLTRKLQQTNEQLQEKTSEGLRLSEDNLCLQRQISQLESERAYLDRLEQDYRNMKDKFSDLEYRKYEAELSVAPLKAKVSHLTKKFNEKDALLRKMVAEVAVQKPEHAAEIFKDIESLSHEFRSSNHDPRLESPMEETRVSTGQYSSGRHSPGTSGDLQLDLDDNDFEVDLNSNLEVGSGGGITLQDLIKEASRPTTGYHSRTFRSHDSLSSEPADAIGGRMSQMTKGRRDEATSSEGEDTVKALLGHDSIDLSQQRSKVGGRSTSHYTPPVFPQLREPNLSNTASRVDPEEHLPITPGERMRYLTDDDKAGFDDSGSVIPSGHVPCGAPANGQHNARVPSYPTQPRIVVSHQDGAIPTQVTSRPVTSMKGQHNATVPLYPTQTRTVVPRGDGGVTPSGPVIRTSGYPLHESSSTSGPINSSSPPHTTPYSTPYSTPHAVTSSDTLTMSPITRRPFPSPAPSSSPLSGTPDPPRALNLARTVSDWSVLLVWKPPLLDEVDSSNGHQVAGYRIYVDGRPRQFAASPHLTKALVTDVNLHAVRLFGVQTVSVQGRSSFIREVQSSITPHRNMYHGAPDASFSDFAREPSSTPSTSVTYERPKQRMFMAVYSYNPAEHSPNENHKSELSFKEGDLIKVKGHVRSDGFFKGMVNGRKGLVPSNFIEEISTSSLSKKKRKSTSHRLPDSSVIERRGRIGNGDGHELHRRALTGSNV